MQAIKVPDLNDSIIEIDIDERTYYLTMSWNSEAEHWVMGALNSQKDTILAGVKVVSNTDLFQKYQYMSIPQISMIAYMAHDLDVPSRDSFNKKEAELIYESKV